MSCALVGLEVDRGAGRNTNLVADDLEEAGWVIGDRISVAVASVGIDGRSSVATVVPAAAFSSTAAAGQHVMSVGIFVDQVVDREGNDFTSRYCLPASVVSTVMSWVWSVSKSMAGTGRDADFIADDLEEAGRVIGDRIECGCRQRRHRRSLKRRDRRTGRRILVHRTAGQCYVCGILVVEIVDREGNDFTSRYCLPESVVSTVISWV